MQTDYLIMGVGNSLRGDDGAGWALATQLAAVLTAGGASVQVRMVRQLLPELAAEISELAPKTLVVADCNAQARTADLHRLEDEPADKGVGSHGLTPRRLLALAVRLYEFSGAGWLATVPGLHFAHGEGLSAATEEAIAAAAPQMAAHLAAQAADPFASQP